ncbi:MAG: hypothetical protein V2A76_00575, partial [Planctomycetota bacterium]
SIVRVCADRKEYNAYGGPSGSAGYWNNRSEELVFYDASASRKIDDNTVAVLYHEAFHQYIFYSVGSVSPHSWFNEGHGDYYGGAVYQGGRFKIEPFRWRIGTVKDAIRQGPRPFTLEVDERTQKQRKVWEAKGYTPLEDLVHFSQGDYYSYPGVSYAQGWSLVYFLREKLSRSQKEKWGHILPTYFDTLKAEVVKTEELKPGGAEDPKEPGGPENPPGEGPGGEDPGGGEEGDEKLSDIPPPPPPSDRPTSEEALKKALEAAFQGVDLKELEKAWIESTLKTN